MYTDLPIKLSLQECTSLLQINPAHFCSATADPIAFGPCSPGCDDFWAERNWSGSPLSRDSLARAILNAELDIERAVGMPLTPKSKGRIFDAPDGKDPFLGYKYQVGTHVAGYYPYEPEYAGVASVKFEDLDEDGLEEVAYIEFDAPENFDPATLVLYASSFFGRPGARIWPPASVEVEEGRVKVGLHCWQVVSRRWLLLPKLVIVDLLSSDTYLEKIDYGFMVQDKSLPQAIYVYDEAAVTCGSPDCTTCNERIAYGVIESVGDFVTVWPAQFNAETQTWERTLARQDCTCLRFPRQVHVTTYSSFCPPTPTSELCDPVKWAIALLAGARVQVGHCECDCSTSAWFRTLQKDQANAYGQRYMTQDMLTCPFGTREGEFMAYNAIKSSVGLVVKNASF